MMITHHLTPYHEQTPYHVNTRWLLCYNYLLLLFNIVGSICIHFAVSCEKSEYIFCFLFEHITSTILVYYEPFTFSMSNWPCIDRVKDISWDDTASPMSTSDVQFNRCQHPTSMHVLVSSQLGAAACSSCSTTTTCIQYVHVCILQLVVTCLRFACMCVYMYVHTHT